MGKKKKMVKLTDSEFNPGSVTLTDAKQAKKVLYQKPTLASLKESLRIVSDAVLDVGRVEIADTEEELELLEEKLLKDKRFVKLKKKVDKLYAKQEKAANGLLQKIDEIKARAHASGMTPEIIKAACKLVDDVFKS